MNAARYLTDKKARARARRDADKRNARRSVGAVLRELRLEGSATAKEIGKLVSTLTANRLRFERWTDANPLMDRSGEPKPGVFRFLDEVRSLAALFKQLLDMARELRPADGGRVEFHFLFPGGLEVPAAATGNARSAPGAPTEAAPVERAVAAPPAPTGADPVAPVSRHGAESPEVEQRAGPAAEVAAAAEPAPADAIPEAPPPEPEPEPREAQRSASPSFADVRGHGARCRCRDCGMIRRFGGGRRDFQN